MFSGDVAILDCLLRQYSGQFLDETELGPILSDDVSVSPVNASHDVGGGGGGGGGNKMQILEQIVKIPCFGAEFDQDL